MLCLIKDCPKQRKARGVCGMHYERWRRTGFKLPPVKLRYQFLPHEAKGGYLRQHVKPRIRKLVHRIIMEQYLNRKLTADDVVHHKNGNRKDNRLQNLEVMTRSEHMSLHSKTGLTRILWKTKWKHRRIQPRKCYFCHRFFTPKCTGRKKRCRTFCSRQCLYDLMAAHKGKNFRQSYWLTHR